MISERCLQCNGASPFLNRWVENTVWDEEQLLILFSLRFEVFWTAKGETLHTFHRLLALEVLVSAPKLSGRAFRYRLNQS